MLIAGLVATTLWALVGWMVVSHGLRLTRATAEERRATERALVTDCLANVDRVIEHRDDAEVHPTPDGRSVDDPVNA